jgi:hypothetical protein
LPNPNFIHRNCPATEQLKKVLAVAIDHQMAVMQVQVGENYTRGCPIECFEGQKMEKNRTHICFLSMWKDSEAKHIYIYQGIVDQPICNCMLFSQLALNLIWF